MFLFQDPSPHDQCLLNRTSKLCGAWDISSKRNPTEDSLKFLCVYFFTLVELSSQVAKAAFQRNNDPLDAAIFYLAMKKKAVIWGLYR